MGVPITDRRAEPTEPVKIDPRPVRVKPHTYQPSKAELEAPIDIRRPDGTRPTPDALAAAVLAPVHVVQDSEA